MYWLMLIPIYVIRPVLGLVDKWHFKLPLSVFGAITFQSLAGPDEVVETVPTLFEFNPTLMAMAVSLYVLDTLTGITRVLYFDGVAGIETNKIRLAGWKLIEYFGVVFIGLVLANGTEPSWAAPAFAWLDEGGIIYVSVTEAVSIVENVTRKDTGAGRILHDARDMALGDWEEYLERKIDVPSNGGANK